MPESHKKYKIQKGDTLESIAKSLDLSVFELRRFHNNHCELENLIGDKLPSRLKELWYESKEHRIQEDFTHLKENNFTTLSLRPQSGEFTYGVTVSNFEGDRKDSLKYLIRLQWLPQNQVRIYREDLYINNEEPTLIAPRLGSKIASALYPLELSLNQNGEIAGVSNYTQILRRWKETENKLRNFYDGEVIQNYMQRSRRGLSHPKILLNTLKQDWFLQSFFNGIYRTEQEETSSYTKTFPLFPGIRPVEYTVKGKMEAVEEEDIRLIRLEIQGKASDLRTRFDYTNRNDDPFPLPGGRESVPESGDYRALYFLDPFSHQIEGLYLECNLELEKTKKAYITASLISKPGKSREKQTVRENGILVVGKGIVEEDPEKPGPGPFSFLAE